jgi:hypothetical protein
MMSWLILVAGVANAQDCQPTSSEQLTSVMQQALIDFATLDEESFFASTQQAKDDLPCLSELFLPPNAAAYHRLMALEAFFNGDDDAATLSFRAALAIEPDYKLSSKLAPEGGKLHRLWTAAKEGPNPFIGSFSAPAGKYAYVDGVETRTYAEDLPNIVQYGPGDDSIDWTGYVPANTVPPRELPAAGAAVAQGKPAPEPSYGRSYEPDPVTDPLEDDLDSLVADLDGGDDVDLDLDDDDYSRGRESSRDYSRDDSSSSRRRDDIADAPKPEKQPRDGKGKGGLIAATAVSAVAAGGLYGSATYFRGQFDRYPSRSSYLLTNGSYFGAIGAGVLTLTFGSLAIFTADGVQMVRYDVKF